MDAHFLLPGYHENTERDIYADKSSLILEWLLTEDVEDHSFSIRDVARVLGVSVGLVQRVFTILTLEGYLKTTGVRTGKKFAFQRGGSLLKNWLDRYNITKKCRMWTYRSGFKSKEELLNILGKSGLQEKAALALHSAAESYGCKNTNLQTLELYLLEPNLRSQFEQVLQLEHQERGYEVLLIEPYYKKMLTRPNSNSDHMRVSPLLLTFLDLYHFPLRGQEQAEFMAERQAQLKRIYKAGDYERTARKRK